MGTKNKPGAFDCYANAAPDEPMFVLLGRDATAGAIVRAWADLRESKGEDPAKVKEARACAMELDTYAREVKGKCPLVTMHLQDAKQLAAKIDDEYDVDPNPCMFCGGFTEGRGHRALTRADGTVTRCQVGDLRAVARFLHSLMGG